MKHTTDEFLLLALGTIELQARQIEILYASHISLLRVLADRTGLPTSELERVPQSVIDAIRQKDPAFAVSTTTIRAAVRELEQIVRPTSWRDPDA
jgi:hypothetical protein